MRCVRIRRDQGRWGRPSRVALWSPSGWASPDDAEVDVVGKSPAEPRKQVAAIDMVLDLCDRCVEAVVNEVVQAGDQVNKFWCRRHAYRPM